MVIGVYAHFLLLNCPELSRITCFVEFQSYLMEMKTQFQEILTDI